MIMMLGMFAKDDDIVDNQILSTSRRKEVMYHECDKHYKKGSHSVLPKWKMKEFFSDLAIK